MIDHIGRTVRDLDASRAFYDAAFAPLGVDVVLSVSAEEPGVRPHYHPNDYGAFVLDPDGRNIEAVRHAPA